MRLRRRKDKAKSKMADAKAANVVADATVKKLRVAQKRTLERAKKSKAANTVKMEHLMARCKKAESMAEKRKVG